MKNLIKYIFAFIVLGSTSVYAQKSSIDSPHNYKRPVFQQRKALVESNSLTILSQASNQVKNDISSVHNYKRQGPVDFTSEANLSLEIPNTPISFNPLLSSNNYKSHFRVTEFGRQVARKQGSNINQTTININKNEAQTSGVD